MSKHTPPLYPWQENTWQQLQTLRNSAHMPHALLLAGSHGIGKTDFAHALANSLLCESVTPTGIACGECKSCKVKHSNAHPDYKAIGLPEGKQQIPISAIRELGDFLTLSRSYPAYRVVLLQNADKMNEHAANSLLKSLEEPPPQTVIILVADQLNRLPATIRSRCQLIHMHLPHKAQALDWLKQQKLQHAADNMLALADGKPLLALHIDQDETLLQQRNHFANQLINLLHASGSVTDMAKDWQKTDLTTLLDWQLKWLQAAIKWQALQTSGGTEKNNAFLQQITQAARDPQQLWTLYHKLLQLKAMTDYPLNRQILLESMLQSWRDLG